MPGMNEYQYNGLELEVSDSMKADYKKDGFVIIRGLFNSKELGILEESIQGPGSLSEYAYSNQDDEGKMVRMVLWNNAGQDVTGALAKTRKMAHTGEQLLGNEVYHYHSKLILKDAQTGGKFVWHQDYGYWYNFACLYPDLITAFVAIDRCGKDNGCLQILRGSHKCGRIEHGVVAGQQGADLTRVAEIEKCLEKVYVELEPGDAMFFHCNIMHTSSSNSSDHRRWAMLSCYNSARNNPYKKVVHAVSYSRLDQLENDAIEKMGVCRTLEGKEILKKVKSEFQTYFP